MERLYSMLVDGSAKYYWLVNSGDEELSRGDFPIGFRFGVGTAAYQVEGAAFEDGRGMTIWDKFSHTPGKIRDATTGDVACNHYHLYKDDIQMMKAIGVDAYRFSISWSRIFPDGSGQVNLQGVLFYNNLIDNLLESGIEPFVTLFHWDLPLWLENDADVRGWLTSGIVKYFVRYAETCFALFGDRVKSWVTFNEIRTVAVEGYGEGTKAPGRCSLSTTASKGQPIAGDSSTEPYLVVHNALLSHVAAVQVYRNKFQAQQKGRIGMVADGKWFEPYSNSDQDKAAAQRCFEFELGWILDPLFGMDYPESMRKGAGSRLPKFTDEELQMLKGSIDFIGYNYYTSYYAKDSDAILDPSQRWQQTDRMATTEYVNSDGELIGESLGPPDNRWIFNCPWGLPKVLAWIEERYGKSQVAKIPIFISENGTMDPDWNLQFDVALDDVKRIEYLKGTLQHVAEAIKEHNYNVQGYFIWSLMDNFEWNSGLGCRFGIVYVDYANNQRRYPKKSAAWYRNLLAGDSSPSPKTIKSRRGCLGNCQSCYSLGLGLLLHICKSSWLFQTALHCRNRNP